MIDKYESTITVFCGCGTINKVCGVKSSPDDHTDFNKIRCWKCGEKYKVKDKKSKTIPENMLSAARKSS